MQQQALSWPQRIFAVGLWLGVMGQCIGFTRDAAVGYYCVAALAAAFGLLVRHWSYRLGAILLIGWFAAIVVLLLAYEEPA
jgi:hypothetical protein